jgi:hypothetical protein
MANGLMMDPFYALAQEVESVKEKVSDSIFENYKLQVAQTNEINNRAMQTAFHTDAALAAVKQATMDQFLQNQLSIARSEAKSAAEFAETQTRVMQQGEVTRQLINSIDRQNLNTALVNTNTALVGGGLAYQGLGLAWGGLNSAYQSANVTSAVNAFGSQLDSQRVVNTGTMADTTQTNTPTSIG